MQSTSNPSHRSNRVSLGPGEIRRKRKQESRRKRKQEKSRRKKQKIDELEEAAAETNVPDDETTSGPATTTAAPAEEEEATVLLTEKEEISLIVTKNLWSDNVETVVDAMQSLIKVVAMEHAANFEENREFAFRHGAPLAVVKAMNRHEACPEIQAIGCGLLGGFGLHEEEDDAKQQVDEIIEIGGLTACILAMDRHKADLRVQSAGCLLIGSLWWFPDLRKTVADGGGLKAVLKAMNNHKKQQQQHSHVLHEGLCYALSFLLHDHESNWAKRVVKAGCIKAVIAAMKNHPDQANLQKHGCRVLSDLAEVHDGYYRNKIIDAKGLEVVAVARRIHKDDEDVLYEVKRAINAINSDSSEFLNTFLASFLTKHDDDDD